MLKKSLLPKNCLLFKFQNVYFLEKGSDMSKKKLTSYQEKRDFSKTTEPSGNQSTPSSGKHPLFVIQEHSAHALHYDLRLEADGVLKSWAVPKGPSTNPADKQLAIQTEDHPLDYASFEGVIPQGEYGAGPVIVWDTGTYQNLKKESIEQCIHNGELTFWLEGKKLHGGFALIKTPYEGKDNTWLLVKMNDEDADRTTNITKEEPASVLSGKTIKEIK